MLEAESLEAHDNILEIPLSMSLIFAIGLVFIVSPVGSLITVIELNESFTGTFAVTSNESKKSAQVRPFR